MSELNPQQSLSLQTGWYGPEAEAERPAVPLTHYLWILRRHSWKIVSFVFVAVICTFVSSKRITPIYESTVTINIDRQTPTGVVGQEAAQAVINDSDQFLATQVRLIQSDSVLRPVVQQFHLPNSRMEGQTRDTPVVLEDLKVTRTQGTYLLLVTYRSPDRNLAADIANAIAKSYRDYTYETRYRATADLSAFMEKQMEELKAKTERSGGALADFEKDLSMINPEQKTSIISARLLQLNTDYSSAQAERVGKESAWLSVQSGTLESLQVSNQGASLPGLEERLMDAKQKLAEARIALGAKHPDYVKAALQVSELERQFESARRNVAKRVETEYREALVREEMLKKEFSDTKAEFDLLNARSFQYTSLKREADTDRGLYEELVRKIKEAGINAGFQNNAIHISDPARPGAMPVYPKTRSSLITALVLSLLVGIAAAILSDKLDHTIRDSRQARSLLGIEVMGSLPLVRGWRGKVIPVTMNGAGPKPEAPAVQSATVFEEAVRTLRNSILLGSCDHALKSLMFTSAAPSEGKTTIAVHVAIAHAQQNHRTLLIDGDLRRPGLHRKMGVSPETGLSAALTNGLSWRDKLIRFEHTPGLELLPAGPSARRCADLIGAHLQQILAEAEPEYDLVIVDSPPILVFPEPLQMAAAVDGVVVVAVAGETNRNAIESVLNTLRRLRANVLGMVLNEVSSSTSEAYYYDGYYGKYYKYYAAKEYVESKSLPDA